MRFYRVSEDWISHLDGEFRNNVIETLRGLDLARLQKYPPPKINGLPLGNETRVLSRFLSGQSSQLDASAFSALYRSRLNEELKLLYAAFRQNTALPRSDWQKLIGEANVDPWIANKCLRERQNGTLECQFSVVGVDSLVFAVDPLKDHGESWEPDFIADGPQDSDTDIQPFFHTYIGQDSLHMIESMEERVVQRGDRYLDCGPGSGGVLLYFARRFEAAVGIDINARAAHLAQFNAELNELDHCRTYNDDALKLGDRYGRFDLVSWNLPFIFMPNDAEDEFIDGFGGEMGIGLCLEFIRTLPGLITENGSACVAALSPILVSGQNVLESRLAEMLPDLGLDCAIEVSQVSLAHTQELWRFHRQSGIRKFESVYLYFRAGSGKLEREESSPARRLIDSVREKMYERKFA